MSFKDPRCVGVLSEEQKSMGRDEGPRAGIFLSETVDVWACWGRNKNGCAQGQAAGGSIFFRKPSLCGRAGGGTEISGPKGRPRAGIFFSETPDVWTCLGGNKNQWAEEQAAGGCNSFSDPRCVGVLGEDQKSMGRRAGAGGYISFSDPRCVGVLGGEGKINGPKDGPREVIFPPDSLDVWACLGRNKNL